MRSISREPSFVWLTRFKGAVAFLLVIALVVGWWSGALTRAPSEVATRTVTTPMPGGGAQGGAQAPASARDPATPPAPTGARPAAGQGATATQTLPNLTIERRGDGQLNVTGTVADAVTRDQWLNAIRIGAQGTRVNGAPTVGPVAGGAPWADKLRQLTALVADRRLDSIHLENDRIVLRGPAVAGNYRRETESLFRAQLPERMRVDFQVSTGAGAASSRETAAGAGASKSPAQDPAPKDAAAGSSAPSVAAAEPARPEVPSSGPGTGSATNTARCPARLDRLTGNVYFKFDSAAIPEADEERLVTLGRCLRNRRVTVIGHADRRQSDEYNLALSRRRAEAVADLIRRNAPPTAIVATAAVGEAESAKATKRESAQRQRRVEILLR